MEWPITLKDQDELDALVRDRIDRERKQVAEAQRRAEKAEAAAAGEKARADKAEAKAADLKAARELSEAKGRVAADTGVPADLIRDGTEEEMRAHAEALAAFAKPPAAPTVPSDTGKASPASAEDESMGFVNLLRH